jgi:prolyl oligopeptidase
VVDEYWGVKVSDPYRYMENLDDPEVQAWIKAQADYTTSVLERIPARDAMLERIMELDASHPWRIYRVWRRPDGRLFYMKQRADENLAKLYWRDGLAGDEHLLFDPEMMETPEGEFYALNMYRPSWGGRYVAYGIAPSGSEEMTLRVLDAVTGEVLPDSIDRPEPYYTPPQWLPDESGFFYVRLQLVPPEAPETEGYKNSKTYLHRLGDDPDNDQLVFAMDQWPGVSMTEEDFPSIVLPYGSDYVVGQIKHGDANQLTLYSAPLAAVATDDTPWKPICDVIDSVVDFEVHGGQVYLLTSRHAPRFRVVRTSIVDPDFANAEEIIPASRAVVTDITVAKDALYVEMMDAGTEQIVRVDYETLAKETLALPEGASSGFIASASLDVDGIYVGTRSWIKGAGTYAYDPHTGTFTDTELNPPGRFDDLPGYEVAEVEVSSHDGVMVPLSIIHKSGLARDGSNPTLLNGYGSYGSIRRAYFSPQRIAWLEQGGIYAVAHVRGGGEYGQEWHLAGQKTTKPNTWKDFIACAEYLIEKGYTSPEKLAGSGGSAGGILIGRAITERPDLFAAALISVGDLDCVRMELTTNGVPNIQEFGTVTIEEEFHALLEMSSFHHVQDGVAYPAVLLTHGINDPRVEPWMSAKMCARLQAATASDKPVLFRVDYQAGHGIGSTKEQYLQTLADQWSFLFWQLGEEDFQP